MGLDAHSYTILGIRVKRSDFYANTGSQYKCIRCLRVGQESEKFCPEDGQKLFQVSVEEATPNLVKYADSIGETPDGAWDVLNAYGRILGIHVVDSIQTAENREPTLAIGIRLGATESHRGGRREVTAVSMETLSEKIKHVSDFANELGLKGPVELFTCLYLSY